MEDYDRRLKFFEELMDSADEDLNLILNIYIQRYIKSILIIRDTKAMETLTGYEKSSRSEKINIWAGIVGTNVSL